MDSFSVAMRPPMTRDVKCRFHLLALPNVQTTWNYYLDGFVGTTIKFAEMLKSQGHEVILYASEENVAPCDELVTCITKEEQDLLLGEMPYQYAEFHADNPLWRLFNGRAKRKVQERKQPNDILLTLGGISQQAVGEHNPELKYVEYSIGYVGCYTPYRVFESRAWQHHIYGLQQVNEHRFFDAVIPLFFKPEEFPENSPEDYFVYCGRFVERKGVAIACQASKIAGVKLLHIGHGDNALLTYGQNLGSLDNPTRNDVLSRAKAVFIPTTYIEPFNQVAVEAQLCGTPVISTDQGGMTETVEQGKTGFRCGYMGEFVQAIRDIDTLDRAYIRKRAQETYSMDVIAPQYQRYWNKLALLNTPEGWNSIRSI